MPLGRTAPQSMLPSATSSPWRSAVLRYGSRKVTDGCTASSPRRLLTLDLFRHIRSHAELGRTNLFQVRLAHFWC